MSRRRALPWKGFLFYDMPNSKRVLLFVVFGIIIIAAVFAEFFSARGEVITLTPLTVTDDIAAVGTVASADAIELGFPFDGVVAQVHVKEGQAVKEGDALVRMDTAEFDGEAAKLEAQINVAKLQLSQMLSGVSSKELALLASKEDEARVALDNAQHALDDQKLAADNKLAEIYASITDYGDTVLLNTDNAIKGLEEVYDGQNQFQSIFLVPDSLERSDAQWQMALARTAFLNITSDAKKLKSNSPPGYDDIDMVVSRFKTNLEVIRSLLQKTSDILDKTQIAFGAPDVAGFRTTMAIQRAVINTTQTALISFEQDIASERTDTQVAANEAQRNIAQLGAALKITEQEYALKQSTSGAGEIALEQAQIKSYEANLSLLNDKISRASLKAPVAGTITSISVKTAKTVKAGDSALSLLPASSVQIEIDAEQFTVVPSVGDQVTVSLGNVIMLSGNVGSVSNSKVVLYITDGNGALRPSESVSVRIRATIVKNALMVPDGFIVTENGMSKVLAFDGKRTQAVPVLLGMRWRGYTEITDGILAGDRIVRP